MCFPHGELDWMIYVIGRVGFGQDASRDTFVVNELRKPALSRIDQKGGLV